MYIFPTYFAKRNFRSHFLRKFLKPLANKICDVMWGWEISTWRTEHSNYLPKSHHGCNLRCIWLYVLLQKYPRVEFFIGSLLYMFQANDFNRDGCRTFIAQFPCRKIKTFLMNNFGIKCFQWDLKVGNIVFVSLLSLRQSLNLCIDNLFYWLQSLYRQYFLLASTSG